MDKGQTATITTVLVAVALVVATTWFVVIPALDDAPPGQGALGATNTQANDDVPRLEEVLNGTTANKTWFNGTFPFRFTEVRAPFVGPQTGPTRETAGNCLGFFDSTPGTRFHTATVNVTWEVLDGPETLYAEAEHLSTTEPYAAATGAGNLTLDLSGMLVHYPDFTLDVTVELRVPDDIGARVDVQGTFEVSYATVNGTIGDHAIGSCT